MRRLICIFVVLLVGTHTSNALYNANSDVISLTPKNFDKVLQSSEIWIVEFFAPWCGHCQNLVPAYEEAARSLKGVVKVAAVDVDEHKELGGRYNIQGFPTIKIFGADKNSPESYEGPRTSKGLIEAALSAIRRKVDLQSGGSRSSGGGGGGGGGKSEDVVELTESNFREKVLNSDDMWLVEFYAPWCGHCKNLAPAWAAAATELKGKVKLGAVDATVHQSLAGEYGIKGYPTIKYFPAGKKDSSSVEDYNGDRSKDGIVSWAINKVAESVPPPEIKELTDNDVLKEACEKHPLCVISILPHILDCQSDCRNSYLKMLNAMGEKYKQKMWGWVWAEAGAQSQLESALEVGGFGYPAMAVLNNKKKKFSILRGSFSKEGINEFLRDLSYGRVSSITGTLRGDLPTLEARDAWDGKDAVLPFEDDIDLSDVDLDEPGKDEL